jgi:t-SNARE complex subunit (syntaxin)
MDKKENKGTRDTLKETYTQIEQDVIQLLESMSILHELVKEQQEPLDTLEDFIQESKTNVIHAQSDLSDASSYSTKIMYMLGGIASVVVYFLL